MRRWPASLRFDVVQATGGDGRQLLHLRVTASDDPAELRRPGIVIVDEKAQTIRQIGRYAATFGAPRSAAESVRRADVTIAQTAAETVTHFSGRGPRST